MRQTLVSIIKGACMAISFGLIIGGAALAAMLTESAAGAIAGGVASFGIVFGILIYFGNAMARLGRWGRA